MLPDEMYVKDEYYYHSPIVRMTKLQNEDTWLNAKFAITKLRSELDVSLDKGCPYLIKVEQEGLVEANGNLYQGTVYEDTNKPLAKWIADEMENKVAGIDVYRLILSGLKTFTYLEANKYVLTQYNP